MLQTARYRLMIRIGGGDLELECDKNELIGAENLVRACLVNLNYMDKLITTVSKNLFTRQSFVRVLFTISALGTKQDPCIDGNHVTEGESRHRYCDAVNEMKEYEL